MENISLEIYDDWNAKKKEIAMNNSSEKVHFRKGDIWWCSLGMNIGRESFGKGPLFRRPVLIIKKLSDDLAIILPLTSKQKEGSWFIDVCFLGELRWVMLYQVRVLHKKRFQHKMGRLGNQDFTRVRRKLEALLELSSKSSPRQSGDRRDESPKQI